MDKDGVGRLAWTLEAAVLNSFEVHLDAATKQQTENRHFSSSSGKIRLQAWCLLGPSVALPQSNIKTVSEDIREKSER